MAYTDLEVENMLRAYFPPGFFDWFLAEHGDGALGDIIAAISSEINADGFALAETLETEIFPSKATERLADLEKAFGLAGSKTASYGSTAMRRAAVLGRLRENGAPTLPNIRAAATALLGYTPTIFEVSRATLTVAHTYVGDNAGGAIPAGGTATAHFAVADTAKVSGAGAQVTFVISHPHVENLRVVLNSPGGGFYSKTWTEGTWTHDSGNVVTSSYTLAAVGAAGYAVDGQWTLGIIDTVASAGTLVSSALFVEGITRNADGTEGLGGAIFEWAIQVDPALVNPPALLDMAAVLKLVRRWNPAHCNGYAVQKASGGGACAVWGDANAIWDASTFC